MDKVWNIKGWTRMKHESHWGNVFLLCSLSSFHSVHCVCFFKKKKKQSRTIKTFQLVLPWFLFCFSVFWVKAFNTKLKKSLNNMILLKFSLFSFLQNWKCERALWGAVTWFPSVHAWHNSTKTSFKLLAFFCWITFCWLCCDICRMNQR